MVARNVAPSEPYLLVRLDPPAPLTVLIKRAFAEELIEIRCGNTDCSHDTTRPSTLRIVTAPHVLVIQICRFDSQKGAAKIRDKISFDEYLELTRYQEGSSNLRYRLRSVVQHSGRLDSGHYITSVRGPRDTWMTLNDSQPAKAQSMKAAQSAEKGFNSYMLFWEKEEPLTALEANSRKFYEDQQKNLKNAESSMRRDKKRKRAE